MTIGNWKPLKIGAGGWLTGIDIAPDGTMVVRTDTYGAYLWNGTQWQQLVTAASMPASEVNSDVAHGEGVYEIKIAPSNSNIFYMEYLGYVYKSTDKGTTWTKTAFAHVSEEPNDANRMDGQKMAVDPNNPNVVYVGTQHNGLLVTRDGGATWNSVSAVLGGAQDSSGLFPGITGITFDPTSGVTAGVTNTIYASSFGHGVYKSTNGGGSWTALAGGPSDVEYAAISSTGVYYAVGNNNTSLWRYSNNTWTQLSLDNSQGIATVSVDPFNPSHIIVSAPSGFLQESLNGGTTWSGWDWAMQHSATDIPWLATTEDYMSIGGMVFDPLVPGKLWASGGVGVWNTTLTQNLTWNTPVVWNSQSVGIEQLVANDIVVAPGGDPVVASWDRPFFQASNLNAFPTSYDAVGQNPFSAGWSVDYASSDPTFLVGISDWWGTEQSGYSTDGGQTWQTFSAFPAFGGQTIGGTIAASSPTEIVWAPANGFAPYYTKDGGATWNQVVLPGVTDWSAFHWAYYLDKTTVTADRVTPSTFYMYYVGSSNSGVYKSANGGTTWTKVFSGEISPNSSYNTKIEAVPGQAGDLFFTAGWQSGTNPAQQAFYHSTDGGAHWTIIPNVLEVHTFGYGAPATTGGYASIYIVGYVNNVYGVWQSDNEGASWTQIGDWPAGNLDQIKTISGDPDVHGQVYVGFQGSGYAYLSGAASSGTPAAPSTPDMSAASDTGSSTSDNITSTTTPTFTGTAAAGSTVKLFDGATQIGSATAGSSGNWSVTSSALGQGAHSITATATDAAGNTSAASAGLSVTIDSTAPSAPSAPNMTAATDTGSSTSDNITSDTTPTFTGTAAPGSTVKLFDGATQIGSATADSGGNWSVTSSALGQGAHSITATATDAAGNTSAASAGLSVTIDSTAPAVPSTPDLATASDTGSSTSDNITSDTTPTFTGTAAAGSTVKLFDGASQIGSATANSSGNWSVTSSALGQGAHSITATATDAGGNTSAASAALSITIGTVQSAPSTPDLATASDTGSSSSDNLTTDTTPTFTGTAAAGSTVKLFDGATQIGSATAGSSGNWSVTSSALGQGAHSITATATDAAGNTSAASAGLSVTIDSTAPSAPSAPNMTAATDTGSSTSDNITSDTTPTFTGTAASGSTVKLFDGATQIGSATADSGGNWSVTSSALGQGAHSITATATDAAGNTSAASAGLSVTIDSTAPAVPSTPDLATASDTGSSTSDNITSDTTPTFTGTAAAGSTVKLFDGASQIGSATANSSGNWSVTSSALGQGAHSITATATDAGGNTSAASAALSITIGTVQSAPSTPDLATASDTGSSSSDNLTTDTTPTFTGTAAAVSTIRLFDGATQIGSATAGSSGNWSVTSSALGQGAHSITATATDAAGNISAASSALSVTIDTAAPSAPSTPDLATASDTGSSSSDNLTNDTTPTFTGTAAAGSTVKLFDGASQIGSATANSSGNWSVTSSALAQGAHSITISATDAAGNVSAASAGLSINIDSTAPAAPSITLAVASNNRQSLNGASLRRSARADDDVTNSTPTFTGTASPGTIVKIFDGSTQIGSATADASGNWSITSSTLGQGTHSITATATDIAGNTSPASPPLAITIGSTAAVAPSTPDLSSAFDTGSSSSDNITSATAPKFTGTATAGSTVKLFDGAVQIGSTTVDSSGNWSVTSSVLGQGLHRLTATATDAAANTSVASGALSITIDSTAPPTPSRPDLMASSDTGLSNTDNITGTTTPKFTGTAATGSIVKLFDGLTEIGSTTANSRGNWTVTSSALGEGTHGITAIATDVAGNTGQASGSLSIIIDGSSSPTSPAPFTLPTSGPTTTTITGSPRINVLTGTARNDRIDGGAGNDLMKGGAGDDTYFVDRLSDSVVENRGQGIDTIVSTATTVVLQSNVENLTLLGSSSHSAFGNDLNNLITASNANDTIKAGAGNDILKAGSGVYVLTGGAGNDMFVFPKMSNGSVITDFQVGQDLIDLREMMAAAGYNGTDPGADHVIAVTSDGNGGSIISVDLTHSGTMHVLVDVQGVTPSMLQLGFDVLWN